MSGTLKKWGALAFLVFWICGCTSRAEKAQNLCRKRRTILSKLYRVYGGSIVAQEVNRGSRRVRKRVNNERGKEIISVLANVVGEADQDGFEEKCILMGRGGRPQLLTSKARKFFSRRSTKKWCRRVVDLQRKVTRLNRKLSMDQQIECP